MDIRFGFIVLVIFFTGCFGGDSSDGSPSGDELIPVNVEEKPGEHNDPETDKKKAGVKLHLHREQSFESPDDIVIGVMGPFTVDRKNRLYIADRDQAKIFVFNPDGELITLIGRQGRGPAEFSAISPNTTMQIHSNQLYVADYAESHNFFPDRLQVFNLDDEFSFYRTILLAANNRHEFDELAGYLPKTFYPLDDGNLIVAYHRAPHDYKEGKSYIRYMVQDSTAKIIAPPILEQKDRTQLVYLVENVPSPYNAITTFPFFGSSLFTVSGDREIFTARTEEFTIYKRDSEGNRLDEIHHPFTNLPLTRRELIDYYEKEGSPRLDEGVKVNMIKEADNLPETWPALNDLLVDDENRLWVSTIVEDFDVYEWWVLEESGELITKFEWPRDEPIEVVKNGNMYTRETDEDTGLQQVVRYRIEMEESEGA